MDFQRPWNLGIGMSYAERHTVSLTTASGGGVTAYTPPVTGRVIACIYDKTDFSNGVDFAITSEVTGQNIWTESDVNASETVAPRQPTHDNAGVASLYAATFPVEDYIVLANERIEVAITSGGSVKSGSITFIIG